jgi:hypothetical protein
VTVFTLSDNGEQNEEVHMSFSERNDLTVKIVKKFTAGETAWLMLTPILFMITACTCTIKPTAIPPTTTAYTPSQDSNKPTATSTNNLTYFFPQQEEVDGEREAMTAQIFGTLVVVENCIRVNVDESDTSYLLVWPPDFTLDTEMGVIQILDKDGKVVAHVGDKVQIDGGEVRSLSVFSESMQERIPSSCSAPYWIVGYEVNVLETSE